MKRGDVVYVSILLVTFATSCALFTAKNARTALDALQLACVFQSLVTDEKALADACGVADDMLPVLRNLVAQREGARRAGVSWARPHADAGLAPADAGGP
jgi:hypothetical protein